MKPGTKEKPMELKIIEGVTDKQRIPENIMNPDTSMPTCPDWVTGYGPGVWKRLAPKLNEIGVLRMTDRDLFAAYCQMVSNFRDAIRAGDVKLELQLSKELRALASEFGLTPSSRSGIFVGKTDDDSEDESAGMSAAGLLGG